MKETRKTAIALGYDAENDAAPRVLATGKGVVAENIIRIAKENNIPIKEDRVAVELLSQVSVGDEIPEDLYRVVAEIYAFIYSLDQNYSKD